MTTSDQTEQKRVSVHLCTHVYMRIRTVTDTFKSGKRKDNCDHQRPDRIKKGQYASVYACVYAHLRNLLNQRT